MEQEFTVVAVHGEGCRDTVNDLQKHRNNLEIQRFAQHGREAPEQYTADPDEAPDVMIILRDDAHHFRIEWPVETWDAVEEWKTLIGWDPDKRHWKHGSKVKVTISSE